MTNKSMEYGVAVRYLADHGGVIIRDAMPIVVLAMKGDPSKIDSCEVYEIEGELTSEAMLDTWSWCPF